MPEVFTPVTCSTCQCSAPTDPPPLGWSPAIETGRRIWTCGECARANIRSIESKLHPAWW